MSSTTQIIDQAQQYMSANYPRYPIAMVLGQGCHLQATVNQNDLNPRLTTLGVRTQVQRVVFGRGKTRFATGIDYQIW